MCRYTELLLEIIGRSSPLDDGEACVYSYGALKFLTMNPALVARLMNLGILDLVVLHLKLITTKVRHSAARDRDPVYMSRKIRKFRTDKFDT